MALWSLRYNISVALAALFLGIGVALMLISARHILLGIPVVFEKWRLFVAGPEMTAHVPPRQTRQWPNRTGAIEAFLYCAVTFVGLAWFNLKIIDLLLKIIA
jgi:hypothetical protein